MSNTNVLDSFISTAQTVAPDVTIETNALLAPYSTVKIGGPAEMLTTVHTTQELTELCRLAQQQKIPITILGWGANTLIADSGIPGLTILNRTNEIVIEQEPFTFTAKGMNPCNAGKISTTHLSNFLTIILETKPLC